MMKEALDILANSWVQLSVAAILVAMFVLGYRKGFIKMSAAFVSIVASLIITRITLPYAIAYVNRNEILRNILSERVQNIIILEKGEDAASDINHQIDIFYDLIGIDKLTDFLGEKAAEFIISVLTFLFVLIVVSLLIRIIFKALDLIVSVPGLSFINRILGGGLGLFEGLVYIWVIILLIGILPENQWTVQIAHQFNEPGSWLYYLKEANLITRIFGAMLGF